MMKARYFSGLLLITLTFAFIQYSPSISAQGNADAQKAILVTGASSGIGRNITETLAANGYFVYAGARKQADIDALNKLDNVEAIRLDVTIQADIDQAVSIIQKAGRGLYGLVNNAGVGVTGSLLDLELEELQWIFDVNVYGVYRMTQAFAPLITAQKGRITTIGSIAGTISIFPLAPYSMSKHALEAYTDALADELKAVGVHVSIIEPGNYKSRISINARNHVANSASGQASDLKSDEADPLNRSEYKEPDDVAAAALHALFDANPKHRYMVVPNQQEAAMTINAGINKLVQMNAQQTYSYSRDELVAMIELAMERNQE